MVYVEDDSGIHYHTWLNAVKRQQKPKALVKSVNARVMARRMGHKRGKRRRHRGGRSLYGLARPTGIAPFKTFGRGLVQRGYGRKRRGHRGRGKALTSYMHDYRY